MEYSTIIYEKQENGVARIYLNRPDKLNSINRQMKVELVQAFKDAENDDEVRVIVLKAKGRAFCAGGDLDELEGEIKPFTGSKLLKYPHQLMRMIWQMPKPIVTAINGYAVGAGCTLAMASDITIATENSVFGLAFIKVGMIPDMGGAFFLPRAMGLQKAKEMAFLGDNISAKEALELGIITKVVPQEELEETVDKLALRLAGMPTSAIGLSKKLLNRSFECDLSEILDLELFAQSLALQSEDFNEGVKAFKEKRKPNFIGK